MFKPFFSCVEDHPILQILTSGLVVGLRSIIFCGFIITIIFLILVRTRSRHFKLQTLAIEDLVVCKARRRCIKTNSLACKVLIINCSLLMSPLGSFGIRQDSSSSSNSCCSIIKRWLFMGWSGGSSLNFERGVKNSDVWICIVYFHESISCWFKENWLSLRSRHYLWLLVVNHNFARLRTFVINHLHILLRFIRAWSRHIFILHCSSSPSWKPVSIAAKCSKLNTVRLCIGTVVLKFK